MKTFILFILTAFCLNLIAQDNLICKYTLESTINDSLIHNVVVSVTTAFNVEEVYNHRVINDSTALFQPLLCREVIVAINSKDVELTEEQQLYINVYYVLTMATISAKESKSKANRLRKDFCAKLPYNIQIEEKELNYQY